MKSNQLILVLVSAFMLTSCMQSSRPSVDKSKSSTTGWKYNKSKNGGFETNTKFREQITGPGLMFIEGGSFTMGRVSKM